MARWISWVAGMLPYLVASGAMAQDGAAAFPKPEKAHAILKDAAGTWDARMKLYAPGSDTPSSESKGVETNTMMEGGFFCLGEYRGELLGQPFVGKSVLGYDPEKGKYVGTWVDSVSARILAMEGTYDEATKTLTMWTESKDPATGKTVREKQVTRAIDHDTREFQMIQVGEGGKETVLMVVNYKRRKS